MPKGTIVSRQAGCRHYQGAGHDQCDRGSNTSAPSNNHGLVSSRPNLSLRNLIKLDEEQGGYDAKLALKRFEDSPAEVRDKLSGAAKFEDHASSKKVTIERDKSMSGGNFSSETCAPNSQRHGTPDHKRSANSDNTGVGVITQSK